MSRVLPALLIVGTLLAGCASVPLDEPVRTAPRAEPAPRVTAPEDAPRAAVLTQGKSRWVPVTWSDLPGWGDDTLHDAWGAWLRNCERPPAQVALLCREVRQLAIASAEDQRMWMMQRLQPYRVEPLQPGENSLLTGYYEPVLEASRRASASHTVPLYSPPAGLASRRPWFTRQEIDTLPQARAALQGREIAYLSDPLDALVLQIQGSGRLRVTEPDGRTRLVRLAFAGSNEQPYRSVGSWLLQQGALRDASWPGIKQWATQNPHRLNEMLWTNPRYVFFREEALPEGDASGGPRGAQGVPLTAGRSIAVDRESIPYGTPVWLASAGPTVSLQRLVFAQDTGSAIVGAVRADYFVGAGHAAGEIAGRLKQPLNLWVLWPR